jgi:hypothetical protein
MRKLCSEQLADRTHNVLRPTLGKMVIREVAATTAVQYIMEMPDDNSTEATIWGGCEE